VNDNRGLIVGSAETSAMDTFNEDFCGFDSNLGVPPTGLSCVGFLWQRDVMTALPMLGGNNAQALGVNNRGQVVGIAETGTQDPTCVPPQVFHVQAVIWGPEPGEIHTLAPLPGDISAWAIGINVSEQIIGDSGDCVSPNFNGPGGTFLQHGAIWQHGRATNIGTLGGSFANTRNINSKGQVVGHSSLPGDTTVHTFVWQKGVMRDLGVVPGDFLSVGYGLNDSGQVVGGSCDQNFNCRAFLWQKGVMKDLNSLVKLGSTSLYLIFGYNVNSRGEIAIYALDQISGNTHAALAVPCDEQHADDEACNDAAPVNAAVSPRPEAVLPQDVRRRLQSRLGMGIRTIRP
jgi:probable HAF family extracellular repeat protein